jgi:uncharacterized protein YdiU (UPF0061 family)
MVEALKHTRKDLTECFDCIQNIDDNTKYKKKVDKFKDFQDVRHYRFPSDWHHIIAVNIRKAHCLVNRDYVLPAYAAKLPALEQLCIFAAQKERFIVSKKMVVLSSFPFFLLYYFGKELYEEINFDAFDKDCKFKHIVEIEPVADTAPV